MRTGMVELNHVPDFYKFVIKGIHKVIGTKMGSTWFLVSLATVLNGCLIFSSSRVEKYEERAVERACL